MKRFSNSPLRSSETSNLLSCLIQSVEWGARPPEARYQQEFYRAFFDVVGPAYSSPEYSTGKGHRKGRIDFFIRSKNWGIELLRDGSSLQELSSFGPKGAHGMWIPTNKMVDYLILDFRSNLPQLAHPSNVLCGLAKCDTDVIFMQKFRSCITLNLRIGIGNSRSSTMSSEQCILVD